MAKNYITYPCKVMRITQNYNGKTSHYPHVNGYPKDYPIDEGCSDSGREGFYCPCDEVKVVRKYGVGNGGVNTLWIESTSVAYAANGKAGIFSALITHPNDSDLQRIKVGQKFKRGELICMEGKDGATANHLHISAGLGSVRGTGWVKNTNGKWVLITTGSTYKPEDIFYIDYGFTKVLSMGGIKFKALPKASASTTQNTTAASSSKKGYSIGNYKVSKADLLRVRTGAGTVYPYKTFAKLSESAKSKVLKLTGGVKKDGYVKGLTFTVNKVSGKWGKSGSGWVCLDYCEKI